MTKCEYNHEDLCALEHFLKEEILEGHDHPCRFAKWTSELNILRKCTAKDIDLVKDDGE